MKKYISSLLLLLSALIWGFSFATQKSAAAIPPFTLGFMRGLLAFLFLLALIPFSDRISDTLPAKDKKAHYLFTKRELIGGALAGVALTLASFLQQLGISLGADAGRAAFITALYVTLVPLYSLALGKKSPTLSYIGVAVAAIGFYLLCINSEFKIAVPDLAVIGCALVFPAHILIIELLGKGCNAIKMSCVQFFTVALINLLLSFIFDTAPDISTVLSVLPEILFLGIVASGVAYTTQIIGQRGTNPTIASLILSLESVFGVIGGAIFFRETLTARELLGCITVLFAVLLCEIDFKALFKRKSK